MDNAYLKWRAWRSSQALVFTAVVIGLLLFAGRLAAAPLRAELWVLGILTIIVGLPHGALDLALARRRWSPRFGRRWLVPFLALYVLLAASVMLAWWTWPGVALSGFLMIAAWHFGWSDRIPGPRATAVRIVEVTARGLAPIVLVAWAFPLETTRLLAFLAPAETAEILVASAAALIPAAVAALTAAAILEIAQIPSDVRRTAIVIEYAALVTLFTTVPPLWSFIAYWIVLHSTWVLLKDAGKRPGRLSAALRATYRDAWPATVLAVAGSVLAGAVLVPRVGAEEGIMRVIFIGLAALTVPHLTFDAWQHLIKPSAPSRVERSETGALPQQL